MYPFLLGIISSLCHLIFMLSHLFILLCVRYAFAFFIGLILLSLQPNEPVPSVLLTFGHSFSLIYICRFRIDLIIIYMPAVLFHRQHIPFIFSQTSFYNHFSFCDFLSLNYFLLLSHRTVYIKQYIGNTPFFILWLHYTAIRYISQ